MAKWFTDEEFSCNHCGELPEGGMNPILVERLDRLREMYGHPIYVSSGYRCTEHNQAVGGVSDSQHIKGNACDIWVNGDYQAFYNLVINSELFDSVGYYPYQEFVHVDVRDNGESSNQYRWQG